MITLPQTVKPYARQLKDGSWQVWDKSKEGATRAGWGDCMREAWRNWYKGVYGRPTFRLNSERRGHA